MNFWLNSKDWQKDRVCWNTLDLKFIYFLYIFFNIEIFSSICINRYL
uniref:Uncharacterized protein n=1 Tax=Megaselia scalaris TaxID=36166 RepID=T1H3G4_MEGSC